MDICRACKESSCGSPSVKPQYRHWVAQFECNDTNSWHHRTSAVVRSFREGDAKVPRLYRNYTIGAIGIKIKSQDGTEKTWLNDMRYITYCGDSVDNAKLTAMQKTRDKNPLYATYALQAASVSLDRLDSLLKGVPWPVTAERTSEARPVRADMCEAFALSSAKHSEQWLMHYPQTDKTGFCELISELVSKVLERSTSGDILDEIVGLSLDIASYNDACNVCALCCCAIVSESDLNAFFSVFRTQLAMLRSVHTGTIVETADHRLRLGSTISHAVRYSGCKSFEGVARPTSLPASTPSVKDGGATSTHHTVSHWFVAAGAESSTDVGKDDAGATVIVKPELLPS